MPFNAVSIPAFTAVVLAATCYGRFSFEGVKGVERAGDGALSEVDAWLNVYLSSATTWDKAEIRTTPNGIMSDAQLGEDVDFVGIVSKEVEKRKSGIKQSCKDCIVPLAVKVCKEAWSKLMSYCSEATDDQSEAACKHYREDPSDFLIQRVLRASVNPIDGGYSYCWWRGKC